MMPNKLAALKAAAAQGHAIEWRDALALVACAEALQATHALTCELITGRADHARVQLVCTCGLFAQRRAALAKLEMP